MEKSIQQLYKERAHIAGTTSPRFNIKELEYKKKAGKANLMTVNKTQGDREGPG